MSLKTNQIKSQCPTHKEKFYKTLLSSPYNWSLPSTDEPIVLMVTWHPLHHVRLWFLACQRDRRQDVRSEVDEEDRQRSDGQRDLGDDEHDERGHLGHIADERVDDRLLQVVEHEATWHNKRHTSIQTTDVQGHIWYSLKFYNCFLCIIIN